MMVGKDMVRRARVKYPFLKSTRIICHKQCSCREVQTRSRTRYNPEKHNIVFCTREASAEYAENYYTYWYKRLGYHRFTLEQFTWWILLHEIAHVRQYRKMGARRFHNMAQYGPSHFQNPLEIRADKWALKELKKFVQEP